MKMHQFGLSVIFIAAVFLSCSQKEILTEVQNANVIAESDNLIKDKINVADEVYARKFADFKERKLPLFRNSMQTKKNNELITMYFVESFSSFNDENLPLPSVSNNAF